MRKNLLEILACPECEGSRLQLSTYAVESEEIKEGILNCSGCEAAFSIKDYIPRFVETDKYVHTFSLLWSRFYDAQTDLFRKTREAEAILINQTDLHEQDVKGRLVLDVGVGGGRFAEVVSRWGAEVVGIDLSFSVDTVRKVLGQRPNVHLVQSDLFHLPFRKEVFDIVLSIGVLHHTPDTKQAFMSLVPFVKRGGILSIYVYSTYFKWMRLGQDFWRKLTTRLPLRLMYYLSAVAIPLYYLYKIPLFWWLYPIFPISMRPYWKERWQNCFDLYISKYDWKHTYSEVFKWFAEAGFKEMEPLDPPICMRGVKV